MAFTKRTHKRFRRRTIGQGHCLPGRFQTYRQMRRLHKFTFLKENMMSYKRRRNSRRGRKSNSRKRIRRPRISRGGYRL